MTNNTIFIVFSKLLNLIKCLGILLLILCLYFCPCLFLYLLIAVLVLLIKPFISDGKKSVVYFIGKPIDCMIVLFSREGFIYFRSSHFVGFNKVIQFIGIAFIARDKVRERFCKTLIYIVCISPVIHRRFSEINLSEILLSKVAELLIPQIMQFLFSNVYRSSAKELLYLVIVLHLGIFLVGGVLYNFSSNRTAYAPHLSAFNISCFAKVLIETA